MRSRVLPLLLGILWLLPGGHALAMGLGAFGGFGYAASKVTYEPYQDVSLDVESDVDRMPVGILFDTVGDTGDLLNYQLALGYRATWARWRGAPVHEDEPYANGITVDNVLGLAISHSDVARIWVGPAVSVNADFYRRHDVSLGVKDSTVPPVQATWDQWDLTIGIGPELGANLFWQDVFSIAIAAGYQYNFIQSSVQVDRLDGKELFKDTSWGGEHLVFFRVGVLLHRWDFGTL